MEPGSSATRVPKPDTSSPRQGTEPSALPRPRSTTDQLFRTDPHHGGPRGVRCAVRPPVRRASAPRPRPGRTWNTAGPDRTTRPSACPEPTPSVVPCEQAASTSTNASSTAAAVGAIVVSTRRSRARRRGGSTRRRRSRSAARQRTCRGSPEEQVHGPGPAPASRWPAPRRSPHRSRSAIRRPARANAASKTSSTVTSASKAGRGPCR